MSLPAQNLSQFDELLTDSRLEPIWDKLRREMNFAESVQFATYIQPESWAEERGINVRKPDQAFFIVVSPNPHPRHKTSVIKTFAFCKLSDWRAQEGEAWRYVGVGDPAVPIFKAWSAST